MWPLLLVVLLSQSPDARVEARARFTEGEALYEKGRFADAEVAFEASYRLLPLRATAWNLGRSAQARGDATRAIGWYRRYLKLDPTAADRASTQAAIDGMELKLARRNLQALTIFVAPVEAVVTVDGKEGGVDGLTLALSPGPHQVDVVATGYVPARLKVELPAANSQSVTIELQAVPPPLLVDRTPAPPPPLTDAPLVPSTPSPGLTPPAPVVVGKSLPAKVVQDVPEPPRPHILGWSATGVALASLAVAVGFSIAASAQSAELRDGTLRDRVAADTLVHGAQSAAVVANIGWGCTALATGLAGYAWFTD